MDLKQELEQEVKTNKFIQKSALRRLITKESVRTFFHNKDLDLGTVDLQDITSRAPKLFAILVLLGQGEAIKDCLQKGFRDKKFPILKKAHIPNIGRVNEQGLYERQWEIPDALPRSGDITFPAEFIRPFLGELDTRPQHGSFGYVYKVRVASGYLEEHESVSVRIPKHF